jgi:hypothetical protein
VDFHGRANLASVKNFQLTLSFSGNLDGRKVGSSEAEAFNDASRYVLQLGKTTPDCFNLDFKYPLSMFQAFAICIARYALHFLPYPDF